MLCRLPVTPPSSRQQLCTASCVHALQSAMKKELLPGPLGFPGRPLVSVLVLSPGPLAFPDRPRDSLLVPLVLHCSQAAACDRATASGHSVSYLQFLLSFPFPDLINNDRWSIPLSTDSEPQLVLVKRKILHSPKQQSECLTVWAELYFLWYRLPNLLVTIPVFCMFTVDSKINATQEIDKGLLGNGRK